MAKGYPDFFGYSIFPQFGVFQIENQPAAVIAHDTTGEVFSISAKGLIYSGYCELYITGDDGLVTPKLTIDGYDTTYPPIESMLNIGFHGALDLPLILTRFNRNTSYYDIIIQRDITFANSFLFEIANASGANVTATGDIYWSRLT